MLLKSFKFAWLAGTFLLSQEAKACTNEVGVKIPSILELPVFETTVEEIEATANQTLQDLESMLNVVLSYTSTMNATAIEKQAASSFEQSPVGVLERGLTEATQVSNRFHLMTTVFEEEEMRDAADLALLDLGDYTTSIFLNEDLYKVLVDFRDFDPLAATLTGARRRSLNSFIHSFERDGIGSLSEEKRLQLQELTSRMTELSAEITGNIAEISNIVNFTLEELDGLSEDQLSSLKLDNVTGLYSVDTRVDADTWDITDYASSRESRAKLFVAKDSRARDVNAPLIHEVVSLRQQMGELLGYRTYADYVLEDKMAKNLEIAHSFVKDLGDRMYPLFQKEMQELVDLNNELEGTNIHTLENFQEADLWYLRNIYAERQTGIDSGAVSEYFEEQATIRALFDIYELLFGITLTIEDDFENKWTEDLQLVMINDASDGSVIGSIYMDLHPREGKYNFYAFLPVVDGHLRPDGNYQAPVALIVGNWPAPVDDEVSLWSFFDVETMFHEFGHAIHHALTCAEFAAEAGTNVADDFAEAPSQMLEYWLKDPNVIIDISSHFETGDPMPMELVNQLLATNQQLPAMGEVRQTAFGLLDLEINSYLSADEVPSDGYGIYEDTNYYFYNYSGVIAPEPGLAKAAVFNHLWGGYEANYYGYAWSRVIAADLAREFRLSPNGYYDQEMGMRYRQEILEKGKTADPNVLIFNFLGRNFTSDAFFEDIAEAQESGGSSGGNGDEIFMDEEDEIETFGNDSGAFHRQSAVVAVSVVTIAFSFLF